jgi:probable addiction module antidote protein
MLKDISEIFAADLKDPAYAAELLRVCLEEEGFDAFLVSLRDIVKVSGGMTALAKSTGLSRESLYKTLSVDGNPEFKTVLTILSALGLKVDFAPVVKAAA